LSAVPRPRLYGELADWWPLLSSPADYEEEAATAADLLERHARGPVRRVLELGSGGGNTASHMKARFELTLSDLSPAMLAVSRALNPGCEHVEGDMRTLRLRRTFDAVFLHDAVMYMRDERDLAAAMGTAFAHLRPGGAALFVPDDTRETWRGGIHSGGHDGEDRALRYLEWNHDPDPSDTTFRTAFAILLRDRDGTTRCVHDEHELGLFPRATWLRLLGEAGFEPVARPRAYASSAPDTGIEVLLGVRP